jgi:type IV pilus assembly protein PilE
VRPSGGFTLLEVLWVTAIAALLYTVALPAYEQLQLGAERRAMTAMLARLQQQQEQFRFRNGRYALQLAELGWAEPLSLRSGEPVSAGAMASYTVTLLGDERSYRLIARPEHAQRRDVRCGVLEVDHAGGRQSAQGAAPQCWY